METGTALGVWAPTAEAVEVVTKSAAWPLKKLEDGTFRGTIPEIRVGDLYRYRLDGKGPYPDPASRFQPQGVHGPSQVIHPFAFPRTDQSWAGLGLEDLVIYELHVGAFTPEGTFAAAQQRLRGEHGRWYKEVAARFHEGCEIVLGSPRENPSRLTCFDWHSERIPWNQRMLKQMVEANGFWLVELARSGRYEFTLRHQPEEAGFPLRASTARLRIGDVDLSKPVGPNATGATFSAELQAGRTRLQTWLVDPGGASRGAFYVYVRRVT